MTGTDPRWVALLDRLEADMRGYADALELLDTRGPRAVTSGSPALVPLVPALDPPDDLGPIPPQLADRARRALARLELLEAQVRSDRDRLAAELDALRAHARTPRGQAEPALFDTTA